MNYHAYGSTDLTVSEVGFGCARIASMFQKQSRGDVIEMLCAALDAGITFFDTANIYGQGESERLLGTAFKGRRDQVIIASKVGYCLSAQRLMADRVKPLLRPIARKLGIGRHATPAHFSRGIAQDFSPEDLVHATEQSLRRLQTDHLDILQLHSPPTSILESGDFLAPLERLKEQGKVRYYGVACETFEDAIIALRYDRIASIQISVNLLDQAGPEPVLMRARKQGTAVIGRQCFAAGLLTKPIGALSLESFMGDEVAREALRADIMNCHRLAARSGRPLPQLALGFAMSRPGVSVTLVGMRTKGHLMNNLGHLASLPLSGGEVEALRGAAAMPGADSVGNDTGGL
jgi:aryl-alcohol dehydrogenase-like predicted oxidoreductase